MVLFSISMPVVNVNGKLQQDKSNMERLAVEESYTH